MSVAIKVENLSKQYRLGQIGTGSIAHDVNRWWHSVRGKEDPYLKIGETNDRTQAGNSEYVWSLKDINFEIQQGDAVGIIGRNGAGKSTLLKILSRVTAPTTGTVKAKGRIASLLEVGTGFHPELSGRENIFLNGAILGMRKAEIKKRFDEMVDFAGVERYIDTPVKRYSSGMYVRLAFAVAAYLESEILIVDEVLAVGDAEFQKKCLSKMGEVSKGEGRTVLFVSHNMISIQKLCKKGILMHNGTLVTTGLMNKVIDQYLIKGLSRRNKQQFEVDKKSLAGVLQVELTNEYGEPLSEVRIGKEWVIKVQFEINTCVEDFISAIGLVNPLEIPINTSWQKPLSLSPGIYCAEFKQNDIIYAVGKYKISIGLSIGLHSVQYIEDAIELNIVPVVEQTDDNVMKYDASTSAILNQLLMKTTKIS